MVHVIYLSVIFIAVAFWNRADRAARIAKRERNYNEESADRLRADLKHKIVQYRTLEEDQQWAEAELKRTKRLLTETQHAVKNAPGKNNGKARRPRVRQRPSSSAHQTVP